MTDYQFKPDYAITPGETLMETLESLGMSQAELARRTGRPIKTINGITNGAVAITHETALQFEKVLSVPASFWNNLESNYRENLARQKEKKQLEQQTDWLRQIPVHELTKRGYVRETNDKTEQLRETLAFYGVSSIDTWSDIWNEQVAFRKTDAYQTKNGPLTAWLRMGELDAHKISCNPYSKARFRTHLNTIRLFTLEHDPKNFIDKLKNLCADAGVAVVFIPEVTGSRTSGATEWLSPDKAMIALSLRYKTNDQFWFTFFHEAAHILFHSKKKTFIDENDSVHDSDIEKKANDFAANFLIPNSEYQTFTNSLNAGKISHREVEQFAASIEIAPGIVVGRLQKDGLIPYSHLNGLKLKYEFNS